MQKTYIKSLLFFVVFLLALGAYYYLTTEAKLDALRDEKELQLRKAKEEKEAAVDSLKIIFKKEAENLKGELKDLAEYSNSLVKKIRRYEKRPDLDYDFVTASSIVAKSKYRPK